MPAANRYSLIALAALLALLGLPRLAPAQMLFVDAAGTCDGMTPCFTTIQQGVNNAVADSAVLVFPGTYAESVNLDLMGSAIAGSPGDISIVNYALFQALSSPAASAAEPAAAASALPPLDNLVAARQQVTAAVDRVLGGHTFAAGDPQAAAALPQVNVFPAAGAAFFHTGTFPGAMVSGGVALAGMTVKSLTTHGVSLPDVNGNITVIAVHADDNKGDGLLLHSHDEQIIEAVTAHRNTQHGLEVTSTADMMILANVAADDNTGNGMMLTASDSAVLFAGAIFFPTANPIFADFPNTSANRNSNGIVAKSDGFVAANFLGAQAGPVIDLNDNDNFGLTATSSGSSDSIFELIGVRANRNGTGVDGTADGFMIIVANSANGNDARGMQLTTTSSGSVDAPPPLANLALLMTNNTASGNAGNGFELSAPNGQALVTGNAAVGNGQRGLQIMPPTTAGSQATGNILCRNVTAGLQLDTNVLLNGEANWWGDPSGPTNPANPAGTGDKVIDGANGGNGTVDFVPFINRIIVSQSTGVTVNQPGVFTIQFTDTTGTAFLGPGLLAGVLGAPLPPDPPFTASTDNGVVLLNGQSAAMLPAGINAPEGTIRVPFIPDHLGPATVTVDGPCGLSGMQTFAVVPHTAAPALAPIGLATLAALLALAGARRVARR